MITSIAIENLKRFRSATVPLRSLNLLTGLNGTGKSTLIQALLLAKQAAESGRSGSVALNDVHGLALGEAQDVLHPLSESPTIGVRLEHDAGSVGFSFDVPSARSLNLPFAMDADPSSMPGRQLRARVHLPQRGAPRAQGSARDGCR